MPLIDNKIVKSADRCRCCFCRGHKDINKNTILYEQLLFLDKQLKVTMCGICPTREDFKKIYGMKPQKWFALNR